MKKTFYDLILLVISVIATIDFSFAKTKIGEIRLQTHSGAEEKVVIDYQGGTSESPELKVEKNVMQVTFPDSYVWPKVEKQVKTKNGQESAQLLAYQFDPNTVRVRLVFNRNIEDKKDKTYLNVKDGQIEMVFPKGPSQIVANQKQQSVSKSSAASIDKSKYDEEYLNQLLGEKEKNTAETSLVNETHSNLPTDIVKQSVTTRLATEMAGDKLHSGQPKSKNTQNLKLENDSTSNLATTAAKMIGVLFLVIGLFFSMVQVAKKGMFKKSGLSFLNDAKMVTVLNTTYLASKRSLVTVKVHNQILLLAQSEAGINFLTEVKGVSDFLKESEREVVGTNFDDRLNDAQDDEKRISKVKLKETIDQSRPTMKEKLADKVSFSAQVKNKLKELKPLQ